MFEVKEKPRLVEKAFLISCIDTESDRPEADSLLDELDELTRNLEINVVGREVVRVRKTSPRFILGKGKGKAIAFEGSLKIKEICYIHAEGYSSSALKHGPFALVEENLPIIILDIGDKNREKNRNAYEELISRKANVIYITDKQTDIENHILIENNEIFGGLIANICIQLIGYYKAIENNINPDFPRNLAKVVTVE